MKKKNNLPAVVKISFSDFILKSLFNKFTLALSTAKDRLIEEHKTLYAIENNEVNDTMVGVTYQGHKFIHSAVGNVNLSFMQLCNKQIPSVNPVLADKAEEVLKLEQSKNMDITQFKGLINGLLSVCRTENDFCYLMQKHFPDELRDFDATYGYDFSSTVPSKLATSFTSSDDVYIADKLELFQTQYKRYKFAKTIIGI